MAEKDILSIFQVLERLETKKFNYMKYVFLLLILVFSSCFGYVNSLYYIDLGDDYIYNDKLFYIEGDVNIPSYIISYNFNENFVIALQANYELSEQELEFIKDKKEPNYEAFKIAKKKGIPFFWIIDKRNDSVFGPLNIQNYLILRKELNIPDELKIKVELEL